MGWIRCSAIESKSVIFAVLMIITITCRAQIDIPPVPPPTKVGCFSIDGISYKVCGSSWTDYFNGVVYNCYCNCPSNGPDCIPASSGGTSGLSSSQSPYPIDSYLSGRPTLNTIESNALQNWWKEFIQRNKVLGPDNYENVVYLNSSGNSELDKLLKEDADKYTVQLLRDAKGGMTKLEPGINGNKTAQLLRKPEEEKTIKVIPPPLPIPAIPKIKEDHEYIEITRDALVTLVGIAPKPYSYLGIAIIDIYATNAESLLDCLDGNCPSSSTILLNAASKIATDAAVQGVGDLGGFASGKIFSSLADRSMIKKGVLPGIDGVVKDGRIAEIGEAHFGIVSAGVDAGKRIINAWGVKTIYDEK